jgi:hypothetical protein
MQILIKNQKSKKKKKKKKSFCWLGKPAEMMVPLPLQVIPASAAAKSSFLFSLSLCGYMRALGVRGFALKVLGTLLRICYFEGWRNPEK